MRRPLLGLLLTLAACSPASSSSSSLSSGSGSGGTSGGSTGTTGLSDTATHLLAAHNQARASAQPAPSPALPALTWNAQAAQVAQGWSAGCVFQHNAGRGNDVGENIAFFGPGGNTPEEVVQLWAAESADYDYASNSCASGKVCGHYTQLVWRDTQEVGCGMTHCTSLQTSTGTVEGDFWVCDYTPAGNFVGQKPY